MITVNFTGGAKKWFNISEMTIDKNDLSIQELLKHLIEIKPKNTIEFDERNLLIAVNGIDSSALEGSETKLKKNDVVNIIPIIHGGTQKRIKFKISNQNIELFEFERLKKIDKDFLLLLRKKFAGLEIQAVTSSFILNQTHAKKILLLSMSAKKSDTLLSKKLETDILLRFAGTTQITDAINNVGITKNQNFFLIAIGKKPLLDKLHKKILKNLIYPFSETNSEFLRKHFGISSKTIDTINSKTPLEDLLCENATVLI